MVQKQSSRGVLKKKRCQKFRKIHRKIPVPETLCTRELQACNFIKKGSLAQVFSCEFCEISKNTFFKFQSIIIDHSKTNNNNNRKMFSVGGKEMQQLILVTAASLSKNKNVNVSSVKHCNHPNYRRSQVMTSGTTYPKQVVNI